MTDAIALSACIIVAQLVMVGVARGIGRKTLFLVALGVLPVRGVLFCLTSHPVGMPETRPADEAPGARLAPRGG